MKIIFVPEQNLPLAYNNPSGFIEGIDRSYFDFFNMLKAQEPNPNIVGYPEVILWGDNTYGQCNVPKEKLERLRQYNDRFDIIKDW